MLFEFKSWVENGKTILHAQSPAKINLFLHITGKRDDGYHNLESVFWPIDLADDITLGIFTIEHQVAVGGANPEASLVIQRTGDLLHIPEERDLTVRALQQYCACAALPIHLEIHIHVRKTIPEEAGLGGGSSNAATVLMLLQQHFQAISDAQLFQLAAQLGADVPFFLLGHPAFVEGIGHDMTALMFPKKPLFLLPCCAIVYKPPINCSTKVIFQSEELTRSAESVKIAVFGFDPKHFGGSEKQELDFGKNGNTNPVCITQQNLVVFWNCILESNNVLQPVVAARFPEWLTHYKHFVAACQNCKTNHNAQCTASALVRMTGSGSAMFALFYDNESAKAAHENVLNHPTLRLGQVFSCNLLV